MTTTATRTDQRYHGQPEALSSLLRLACASSLSFFIAFLAPGSALGDNEATDAREFSTDARTVPASEPEDIADLERRFLPNHEPLEPSHSFEIRQGQTQTFAHRVVSGQCYAAVALGVGLQHLDIDLFLEGQRVGQDVRRDSWPIAEFCAPRSGDLEVRLFATRGNGVVRARMLMNMDSRHRSTGDSNDVLVNQLSSFQRRVLPRSQAVSPIITHEFPRAGQITRSLATPDRGCFTVTAVASDRTQPIAIRVRRLGTILLDEDLSSGETAAAGFCVDAAGFVEVDLVSESAGRTALQLIGPLRSIQ